MLTRTKTETTLKLETLADVDAAIQADPSIPEKTRKKFSSAISRTARLLQRPASGIHCAPETLRAALKAIHPQRARLSAKSLANIKSELVAALRSVGVLGELPRAKALSLRWRTFLSGAAANHQRWHLARFARFCSAAGIEPEDVTDATVERYQHELSRSQLTGDPDEIRRDTARNFNRILHDDKINRPVLSVPSRQTYRSAQLKVYPEGLQADIGAYLARLANPSPFDEAAIDRPLAPTSLRNIELHLRQSLDAAVQAGYPRTHFNSLADLIDIAVIKSAFDVIEKRTGTTNPPTLHNISATLLAIARYHVKATSETLRKLEAAKRKLSQANGAGRPRMTEKNTRRLHQFDDPEAAAELIMLPETLMKRADRQVGSYHAGLLAMRAVAITILLACAPRAKNLAALDIDRHLYPVKSGRKVLYRLHIPAKEVKNRSPIDAELGEIFSRLLTRYIDKHRPHILETPSSALFPRRNGQPRAPKHLGNDVTELVRKEIGVDINPHLYRHFAAKTLLEARPGNYEIVRRVLGHAKMDTTTGFYASFDTRAAYKLYGSLVDGLRDGRDAGGKL